jgi:hypothetical protein
MSYCALHVDKTMGAEGTSGENICVTGLKNESNVS